MALRRILNPFGWYWPMSLLGRLSWGSSVCLLLDAGPPANDSSASFRPYAPRAPHYPFHFRGVADLFELDGLWTDRIHRRPTGSGRRLGSTGDFPGGVSEQFSLP